MKKRYIALAVAGVASAAAVCTVLSRNVSGPEQKRREAALETAIAQEFTPVLRFAVTSDIHINADDTARNERLGQLFETAYRYADNHESYKNLDAVIFVGDNTDGGSQAQYDILKQIVNENLREGTAFIPVMGNHDLNDTEEEGHLKNLGKSLDVHEVVNGFHFIGLSPQPDDTWHTPKQVLWMAKELHKAKKDDPNKPIFTFQHGHIWKTVYVSRSWYTQMSAPLHAVYSMYPQVINFSGHSHGPLNHPQEVWQSRYTLFGTGTLRYFEMERDITKETVPAGAENAAQYLIVEVDAENRVRVLPFNILTDDFFKTPSTTDAPEKQLVYFVENVKDRSAYVYTKARKKTDPAPRFAENAAVAVSDVTSNSAAFTFDQAEADVCVYGYRLDFAEAARPNKTVLSKGFYSEYYFEPMPEQRTVTVEGLAPGTEYVVKVTPLNAWLSEGEPITAAFKTSD